LSLSAERSQKVGLKKVRAQAGQGGAQAPSKKTAPASAGARKEDCLNDDERRRRGSFRADGRQRISGDGVRGKARAEFL